MHDERGVFYYPNPAQKTTRMYVRRSGQDIEFRLFSSEDASIWDRHQWITLEIIKKAMEQFDSSKANPMDLYDVAVARAVLDEADR